MGAKAPSLLRLQPRDPLINAVPKLDGFGDADYFFSEKDIDALAATFAQGLAQKDSAPFKAKLRAALPNGRISLKEILPAPLASRLGTYAPDQTYFCYRAAMNFHMDLPFQHVRGVGPTIEDLPDFVLKHYRDLKPGETPRFGDMLFIFKRMPPEYPFLPMHVAIYVGGDLFFHKFGPRVDLPYELSTLQSMQDFYFESATRRWRQSPDVDDWKAPASTVFLRYDGPLR